MGEKISATEANTEELILACADCGERRALWTRFDEGGHSLEAALAIADEFDALHDETCGG